jgi:sodium/hydrogen exchanger family protein
MATPASLLGEQIMSRRRASQKGKRKLASPTVAASFHLSLKTCGSSSAPARNVRTIAPIPVFFLIVKVATKIIGVYPVTKLFGAPNKEAMYTTLLMSTGLTFGTISSLFGLSHGIIDKSQYSALVAAVIGSAVIPTVIANAFYLPRHLLPDAAPEDTLAEEAALSRFSRREIGRIIWEAGDVRQDSARQ